MRSLLWKGLLSLILIASLLPSGVWAQPPGVAIGKWIDRATIEVTSGELVGEKFYDPLIDTVSVFVEHPSSDADDCTSLFFFGYRRNDFAGGDWEIAESPTSNESDYSTGAAYIVINKLNQAGTQCIWPEITADLANDTDNAEAKLDDLPEGEVKQLIGLTDPDNSRIFYYYANEKHDELIRVDDFDYYVQVDTNAAGNKVFEKTDDADECSDRIEITGSGGPTYDDAEHRIRVLDATCKVESSAAIRIGEDEERSKNPVVGPLTKDDLDSRKQKGGPAGATDVECDAGPLSWIVCTVIDAIKSAADWFLKEVITPFLKVSPLQAESGNTVFESWKGIRNLANILLIPVFFVLIFAQALSLNIDAYTIKKMLPKLVAAVILIQFSFYAVAFLVDIFNVLGNGIGDLLTSAVKGEQLGGSGGTQFKFGEGESVAAGLAITLGLLLTVPFAIAIFGFLLILMLALLAVVVTLIFRQVLIVFLAILAPVAFVAWVLPNTQGLFKLWWDSLLKALAMYPLIVMLFAAAVIGSSLISGGAISGPKTGALRNNLETIAAIILLIIPFALIPLTFRLGGTAMAGIASGVQNFRGRLPGGGGGGRRGGGPGGPGGQPRPGTFRDRMQQYRRATAAGVNRTGRIPLIGGVARVMSRQGVGIGRGARTGAQMELQRQVGENVKEIENLSHDQRNLLAFGSRGAALAAIDRQETDRTMDAAQAARARQNVDQNWGSVSALARNPSMHLAAFSKLAEDGLATHEQFASVRDVTRDNPQVRGAVLGKAAFDMYSKGSTNFLRWSDGEGAANDTVQSFVGRMGAQQFAEAKDLGDPVIHGVLIDRARQNPETANALRHALTLTASPNTREDIRLILESAGRSTEPIATATTRGTPDET